MYCKNCGKEMDDQAYVCVQCGVRAGMGNKYCGRCGNAVQPGADFCLNCGVDLHQDGARGGYYQTAPRVNRPKSKLAAGLLSIFLGGFGVHNFYLGFTGKGVAQIVLTLCSCGVIGSIWGFIEGILILTGTIHADADGVELVD